MLEVKDLNAYYGKSHILRGVNLKIENGEIVSLLGRNGVGRSTTCKAIMGEVEPIGSVRFNGNELANSFPLNLTDPIGSTSPIIALHVVDLPTPFRPSRETISPFSIFKLTPLRM